MSLLALALALVGALATLNLTLAALIRVRLARRRRRDLPVRAAMGEAVALFCAEVEDELPPAAGRRA